MDLVRSLAALQLGMTVVCFTLTTQSLDLIHNDSIISRLNAFVFRR